MKYHVFLKEIPTGYEYELRYSSITTITELNNGGSATFTFDYPTLNAQVAAQYGLTVAQLFTSVMAEIRLEDNNQNILWLGVVSEYKRSKDANGTYQLTIAAIDYFALFQKRRTAASVTYTGQDLAAIPWQMINTSQGLSYGNLGITQGSTASTGTTITQQYLRAEIKQSIQDLSNYKLNGSFDFDIDVTKKFNVYYPTKGSVRQNVVIDDTNLAGNGVDIPLLLNMTNNVYSRGSGANSNVPETLSAASGSDISAYTLLEDIITDTQTTNTTVLQAEGDFYLKYNKLPLYQISVNHNDSVDLTTYDVGDTIVVNIKEENISYQQYRVRKRTINIDSSNTMIATLDLLIY